ncbi:MAG: hypothetical protein ACFFCZ_14835 [Promethearchaeota archaeon]
MTEKLIEQDLITKKRETIKTVSSEIWHKYVHGKYYKPILESFNTDPITIDEICSHYSQTNQEKKSNSTIYRYLKDLVNNGLVIDAGRRMYPNQVSSKTLYDCAASMIVTEFDGFDNLPPDHADQVAKQLGLMVKRHFNNKIPNYAALKNVFTKFDSDLYHSFYILIEKLVLQEKTDEKARTIIKEIYDLGTEAQWFFEELAKVLWFLQKQNFNELRSKISACFRNGQENRLSNSESLSEKNIDQTESQYQDIITYYPRIYQYISDETWTKMRETYNHRAIMRMLRVPMTLKEIHKKHHEAVLKKIEEDSKSGKLDYAKMSKRKPPKEKKENTIYGYIQDLKKWGLVVEAGRRITEGKSITEILYVRKAIYVTSGISPFDSEIWKRIVHVIGQTVQYALQKKQYDPQKFYSLLTGIRKSQSSLLDEIYGEITAESLPIDMLSTFSFEQDTSLWNSVELIEWLVTLEEEEDLQTQLLNCFFS